MTHIKRAVAVHDISCAGRCSLTVALPIISSAGFELSVLPTALLSTHTAGFDNFTYKDLTYDMQDIVNHWQLIPISFDCLYSGFLSKPEQVKIIKQVIKYLCNKNAVIIVDPVLGDNGELYKVYNEKMINSMKELCEHAHLITPNLTEACLLLNESFKSHPYSIKEIENMIKKLSSIYDCNVIITSVHFNSNIISSVSFDKINNKICYTHNDKVPGDFHGTGDIFSSIIVSALLHGNDLGTSIKIAGDYVYNSLMYSNKMLINPKFGVNFESHLSKLKDYLEP